MRRSNRSRKPSTLVKYDQTAVSFHWTFPSFVRVTILSLNQLFRRTRSSIHLSPPSLSTPAFRTSLRKFQPCWHGCPVIDGGRFLAPYPRKSRLDGGGKGFAAVAKPNAS